MDYPKSVPSVGLVNGKFVDENPVNGTPGSLIPSSWGNAVTDEILSVIRSTNAVPTESNNAQLTDAIVSIADLRASQAISKSVVPATESVSGVAKVATQAQTNSGVDDTTIVTPKKMAGAVQGQALVAFTTGGTAPLFTLAPVPAISAYMVNQRFQVKFHSGGAGSDKMNVSGLGAKSIMQYDANGNKVAAVIQGQLTDAVYDGTDIVLLDSLPPAPSADPWLMQPIGVPIPVLDHLAGASVPPTTATYRYIKLTAADTYNSGVLTSETVTGSAPLVQATAIINLTGSPVNGQTVRLINTEERVLRAGVAGTVLQDAVQDHTHASGAPASAITYGVSGGSVGVSGVGATTGAMNSGRTATETRVKSLGVTYYMRIK